MKKIKFSKLLSVAISVLMLMQMFTVVSAEYILSDYSDRIISVETIESAPTVSYASIVDGKVALNDGNYVDYIDRVDVPDYAVELYNTLSDVDFWLDEDNFAAGGANHYEFNYGAAYEPDSFIAVLVATIPSSESSSLDEVNNYCRAAFDALDRDYPEIFWLSGQSKMSAVNYGDRSEYYFILTDFMSGFDIRRSGYTDISEISADVVAFNTKVNDVLSTATGTDYQKILAFNTYLTKNNSYNSVVSSGGSTPDDSLESFNAMMGNTGATGPVCEAYARAFKVLCDRASIPCVLVDGQANEAHMWNYVELDGKWYAVDVTWNDPTVSGTTAAVSGSENTKYLAVGSTTIIDGVSFGSRTVENCVSVGGTEFTNGPVLNTTKYDPNATVYYTVTFDANGHGTAPASQSVEENGLVTKPADPEADGYIFNGWLYNGSAWDFENDTVTSSITLTADWEEIVKYTVTFDANGHGTAPASQSVEENGLVTKPADPTETGYVFDGWFYGGSEWDFDTDVVTGNITLTAQWSEQTLQLGDVNASGGKPNIRDVVLLYQYVSNWNVTIEESVADVNASGGKPNIRDVVLLYQYVSGWNVTLG